MKRRNFLVYIPIIAILFGCGSTKMYTNRKFVLDQDVSIAVETSNDPYNLAAVLEGEMLNLGLNVVPYDMAQRKAETDINFNRNNVNISSSNTTYVPSALFLRVNYSYSSTHIGAQIKALNIRLIDLSNQRVLASFQYDSSWGTTKNSIVSDFIKELRKYVK